MYVERFADRLLNDPNAADEMFTVLYREFSSEYNTAAMKEKRFVYGKYKRKAEQIAEAINAHHAGKYEQAIRMDWWERCLRVGIGDKLKTLYEEDAGNGGKQGSAQAAGAGDKEG